MEGLGLRGLPGCRGPTLHLKFCKPSLTVPLPLPKIEAEPRAPPPIPSPTRAPIIDSRRKLHPEPDARVPLRTPKAYHPRRPPVASLPDPSGAVSDVVLPMLACCPDSSTGPQPLPHSSLPPSHSEMEALHSSFLDPICFLCISRCGSLGLGRPGIPNVGSRAPPPSLVTPSFSPPFSHPDGYKQGTRRVGLASGSPGGWGKCLKDLGKFKSEGQWEMGWRGGWRNRKEQEKLEVSPPVGEGKLSQSLLNGTCRGCQTSLPWD